MKDPAEAARALARSSPLPVAVLELPSGRFLAVNQPLASALGATADALAGASSLDWLHPHDRDAARQCLQALADGGLTGYQAVRKRADPADDEEYSLWVCVADADGVRVGLVSVVPLTDRGQQAGMPVPEAPAPGDLVLGTVDESWRIDRISQDVAALLGMTPDQCVGVPVLGAVYPSDVPGFLAAVEHSRRGERAVRLPLRLSSRAQDWAAVTAV